MGPGSDKESGSLYASSILLNVRHNKELQAAKTALAPRAMTSTPPSPSKDTASLPEPWHVPPQLLQNPILRDVASTAISNGKAAYQHQDDPQKLLQFGLNLQELAARLGAPAAQQQLNLLQSACTVYSLATKLSGNHVASVLFNWAVALSDISRLQPTQTAKIESLSLAADKYSEALVVDPNNPQALNNWALVLNDLQSFLSKEGEADGHNEMIPKSVTRFRAAIRLLPEVDTLSRFCYNLGTVLYAYACTLQEQQHTGGSGSMSADDKKVRSAFAHASQYIVLSYALNPRVGASEESLTAVQRLLPLPHLRSGPLQAISPITAGKSNETWVSGWFALDAHQLQGVRPPATEVSKFSGPVPDIIIDLADITDAQVCLDPSLPEGCGIWLASQSQSQGIFLVAATREEAEGWVDAVQLVLAVRRNEQSKDRLCMALLARRMR